MFRNVTGGRFHALRASCSRRGVPVRRISPTGIGSRVRSVPAAAAIGWNHLCTLTIVAHCVQRQGTQRVPMFRLPRRSGLSKAPMPLYPGCTCRPPAAAAPALARTSTSQRPVAPPRRRRCGLYPRSNHRRPAATEPVLLRTQTAWHPVDPSRGRRCRPYPDAPAGVLCLNGTGTAANLARIASSGSTAYWPDRAPGRE